MVDLSQQPPTALPQAGQPFAAPVPMLPAGEEPLAQNRTIELFNQGQSSRRHLLRVTAHSMIHCGSDWRAALRHLDDVALARDPATGGNVRLNLPVFNGALRACARAGRWPEAVNLFNRMIACDICPDSKTYTLAITACRRGGNPVDALGLFSHLHAFAVPLGIRPTIHTLTTVISALGEAGRADTAVRLFHRLLQQSAPADQRANLRTCHAMLEVCARSGRQADAMGVLQRMDESPADAGVAPDGLSYMHALGACEPEAAQALLDRGLQRGLFRASLGYDGQRKLLDLRRGAILGGELNPRDDGDASPALAAAVVRRLVTQGVVDAQTVIVCNETGGGGLPPSVRDYLARTGGGGPGGA